jgi:cytochrome c oxidase subunit III
MAVITQREAPGTTGLPPAWPPVARGGGDDGGAADSSFPVSPKELATWFLLTGIGMLFGGFASAYIVLRGVPSWESVHLPSMVWSNTGILLISSITFELARRAVKKDRTAGLRQWLALTGILGVVFVAGQIEVWRKLSASGMYLASNLHGSFFYVLSGIHAVHILGGLIALSLVVHKAWSGKLTSQSFEPLRLCATYWHFMGGVWLFLLLLLVVA